MTVHHYSRLSPLHLRGQFTQGSTLLNIIQMLCHVHIITTLSVNYSYQTLKEPGRPGDDDENLLDQFGDDGHLFALWTLIRLIRKETKDNGLLLQLVPPHSSCKLARQLIHRGTLLCLTVFLAPISSSYFICCWFKWLGLIFRHIASMLVSACCLARLINNTGQHIIIESHCLHILV